MQTAITAMLLYCCQSIFQLVLLVADHSQSCNQNLMMDHNAGACKQRKIYLQWSVQRHLHCTTIPMNGTKTAGLTAACMLDGNTKYPVSMPLAPDKTYYAHWLI